MKILSYTVAMLAVCGICAAAVLGPQEILRYADNRLLNRVTLEEKGISEVYRYEFAEEEERVEEKLYILAHVLSNRVLPQSEYFAAIRRPDNLTDVRTQSYAFQPIRRENEFNDETRRTALYDLQLELTVLSQLGVLPALSFNSEDITADLYIAIDMLEPLKSVTVWHFKREGTILPHGLADCVMDAHSRKIYSISFRDERDWEQYETDRIVRIWAKYLNASEPQAHQGSGLQNDASYFETYGIDADKIIVTLGYYEGVKEFFIRLSPGV